MKCVFSCCFFVMIFVALTTFFLKRDAFYAIIRLTLYSLITPLKYHVFENIMENEAFALLEQMLHFP